MAPQKRKNVDDGLWDRVLAEVDNDKDHGHVDRVEGLLQEASDKDSLTRVVLAKALWRSCVLNCLRCTRLLLCTFKVDANSWANDDRKTPLMFATSKEMVDLLVANGANVNAKDRLGRTPLTYASSPAVVSALVTNKADLETADMGNRSALIHAILQDRPEVAKAILASGAKPDSADAQGRTVLMTSIWKNQISVFQRLLDRGALVDSTDDRSRNILHHLCEDRNRARRSQKREETPDDEQMFTLVLDAMKKTGMNIDAESSEGKTALYVAAIMDNEHIVRKLADNGANFGSTDTRNYTPLHYAATNANEGISRILLQRTATINAATNRRWSALHFAAACTNDPAGLVNLFLDNKAAINAKNDNHKTPLHLAAEVGNVDTVNALLDRPGIDVNAKDRSGDTAMFTAAKLGNKGIVRLLASHTYAALTEAALEASKAFPARVVDFTPRAPSEPNATGFKASSHKKIRVHHLLAGEYEVTPDFPLYSAAGSDEQLRGFRWIHLPANNTAWCQELLVRRFIEQDAADPDSFKALETSFTHEHIGTKLHARYMRPTCRLIHRAENATHFGKHSPNSTWLKRKGKRNAGAKPKLNQGGSSVEGLQVDDDFGLAGVDFPSPSDGHSRKPSQSNIIKEAPFNNSKVDSLSTNDEHTNVTDSMYLYMPYVHFEWTEALRKMQKEVTTARAKRSTSTMYDARHKIATRNPSIPGRRVQQRWSTFRGNASGAHRDLIHAHVDASICSLHVRRTLDQFFYRTIDTSFRDKDQVVLRHQRSHCKNDCELHQCNCDNQKREHSKAECDKAQGCTCNAKILMVDQLWMWIVSSDLIITSFPQRWDQSASDLDDVYEGILNDITAATHKDISDVYELAMIITSRCTGALHFEYTNVGETLFLDVFESAIGHAMNWETKLFAKFEKASHEASKWLRNRRTLPGGPLTIMREDIMTDDNDKTGDHDWTEEDPRLQDSGAEPPFIQTLLDIRDETLLLREIKDIRDELEMLKLIFTQQQKVCEEARKGIMGALERHQAGHHQRERLQRLCDEQQRRINNPLKDVERMLSQTERIYKSNKDLLDLKQKYANALQASDTARQGQTLMVFTIVTVVFLPLSFTAAFFAIPIESFPHNSQHAVDMSLEYVSKYVFGVGIAIALPCVVVALTVKQIVLFAKERQRGLRLLFRHIPRALTRAAPQPSSDGSPPAVDAPVQGASVPNGESKPIGPPANPGRSILHWMRLRQGSRNDGDVGESHTVNGNV